MNTQVAHADRTSVPRHRGWWSWTRLVLLGTLLAAVTGAVTVLPVLPTGRVTLDVGYVTGQDVRAPRSVTYASAILRAEEQAKASARVQPVYTTPDPSLARQKLDRARQVLDYLGSVTADRLASPAEQRGYILAVPELVGLSPDVIGDLLALSEQSWNRVQLETLAVIDQGMRKEIRDGFLAEALLEVPALVSLDLSATEAAVTIAVARAFLATNSFLDPAATVEAQARAREEVPTVLRTFEAGEVIVREGTRVTALDIEALDQLELRYPRVGVPDFAGAVLLALLGTALLFLYLAHFQPVVLWSGRELLLLVLLVVGFVLIAAIMVPGGSVLRYLAPTPALAILVTAALGPQAGVASAVFVGGAVGAIADNSLEMATYTMVGGIAAALTLGKVDRIRALFRAGAFVALAHVSAVLVFGVPQQAERPGELLASAVTGIANGGISASLALGGLFLIGPLFDVITTLRLIELSRPDQPLLQRLLREAPGTYHHTLMVANLAEHAAERIGANALLTRVGAYYHDIGKIARPYFFAENQLEGSNPHDELDPHTSAEVIAAHIQDGMELARRYRLPSRIQEFIPAHHGTNWVSFFYGKAVELAGDAKGVDERDFRYTGPAPRHKETALVMLADGCEATVRALHPASAEETAEIVAKVIAQRLGDGQLDESDLTLHDLQMAREAFVSVLKGLYHPRIQYPQSGSAGSRSE